MQYFLKKIKEYQDKLLREQTTRYQRLIDRYIKQMKCKHEWVYYPFREGDMNCWQLDEPEKIVCSICNLTIHNSSNQDPELQELFKEWERQQMNSECQCSNITFPPTEKVKICSTCMENVIQEGELLSQEIWKRIKKMNVRRF